MRDVYQSILRFNQGRNPEFLKIKYKLMASSAFRFFRGSCHLYYADLAAQQTWQDQFKTWVCGDLHVENFGTYRSLHQVVYFDLNDFDEACLAHPTWEVSRFICSIFLAGKELKLTDAELRPIAAQLLDEYLKALQHGKAYVLEKETVKGVLGKYIKTVAERDEETFLNARSKITQDRQRTFIIDQKNILRLNRKH